MTWLFWQNSFVLYTTVSNVLSYFVNNAAKSLSVTCCAFYITGLVSSREAYCTYGLNVHLFSQAQCQNCHAGLFVVSYTFIKHWDVHSFIHLVFFFVSLHKHVCKYPPFQVKHIGLGRQDFQQETWWVTKNSRSHLIHFSNIYLNDIGWGLFPTTSRNPTRTQFSPF